MYIPLFRASEADEDNKPDLTKLLTASEVPEAKVDFDGRFTLGTLFFLMVDAFFFGFHIVTFFGFDVFFGTTTAAGVCAEQAIDAALGDGSAIRRGVRKVKIKGRKANRMVVR